MPCGVDAAAGRPYKPRSHSQQSYIDTSMANTKSAKKAARQIARRTVINKSRRSRVRSAVRKVEEALAAGDRSARARRHGRSRAGADSRGAKGHRAPQCRAPQSLAARPSHRQARAKNNFPRRRCGNSRRSRAIHCGLPSICCSIVTSDHKNRCNGILGRSSHCELPHFYLLRVTPSDGYPKKLRRRIDAR